MSLGAELEGPTIVNVGYTTNKAGDKWEYTISCFKGKKCVWSLDITPEVELDRAVDISESETVERKQKIKRVRKKAE